MKRSHGFTLIELLVVLSIAAILVTLAVPNFTRLVRSTNVASAVNTFLSDTRFARSEATRLGGTITMCRPSVPETTPPTCSNIATQGWETGWLIFVDQDRNGNIDFDSDASRDDRVLRVQQPITSVGAIGDSNTVAEKLQFVPTGRMGVTPSAASPPTITFGGSYDATLIRKVCIGPGGRARVGTDAEPCP